MGLPSPKDGEGKAGLRSAGQVGLIGTGFSGTVDEHGRPVLPSSLRVLNGCPGQAPDHRECRSTRTMTKIIAGVDVRYPSGVPALTRFRES